MRSIGPCALVIVCCGLTAGALAQDVIRLKRGGLMEGLVVEETSEVYVLQIAGGTINVRKDLVAELVRSGRPEDDQRRAVLSALTRFPESRTFHFLYRNGQRVGYRSHTVRPEVAGDTPGYVIEDRLAFMNAAGQVPSVEIVKEELVDAELRPVSYAVRHQTGGSGRVQEGQFEPDGLLRITEREAGTVRHRMTILPPGVRLPGALLVDLAREGAFEGEEASALVFDPVEERFESLRIQREQAHRVHRGEERSVRILRQHGPQGVLEAWADRDGALLRQEILTPGLVALRAPASEVQSFARGDDPQAGSAELGLALSFEAAGVSIERPDPGWEVQPGDLAAARVATLTLVREQATMDLLRLEFATSMERAEEVALKLMAQMSQRAKDLRLEAMLPLTLAGRPGVRFVCVATRRDVSVRTAVYVFGEPGRWYAVLAAAPERQFASVEPDFDKAAQTLDLLRQAHPGIDPFEAIEKPVAPAPTEAPAPPETSAPTELPR